MATIPATATYLYYEQFGRAEDVLKIGELPVPQPTSKQVLIKVHVAGINALDCKRRNGDTKQLFSENLPIRVGYECSGVIVQVGEEVSDWKVGQEVIACVGSRDFAATGTVGEYIAVDDDSVALKPSTLSHRDGAAIPMASVTAYQVLKRLNVKEGGSIIISGGAGGVGLAAIQMAKNVFKAGRVVTTASLGVKTALVKSVGAVDDVIDYRVADWETKYKGDKFDCAFDTTGDSAKLFPLVKPGGAVVTISDKPSSDDVAHAVQLNWFTSAIVDLMSWSLRRAAAQHEVTYNFHFTSIKTTDMTTVATIYGQGQARVLIDSTFALEDATKAEAKVASGRAGGKVVVEVISCKLPGSPKKKA
ncbi:TPA: hypothetical protein N0F65_007374 [Lagenidium giganteum]|uniref:Enoyl reductase (ER) domain-containing protein n=1 Tax=Lagenidium giganteum TaxID=4803 RepID=A0AAV2YKC6_9STRA|nr:TPA: hypothetical protein N0F65_007374 [Lagenidium giganteum]